MKIDLNEFNNRSGYISRKQHPSLPLYIWNYTAACQYERAWDTCTKRARGLITDLEGNIISRPFPKFFNIDENDESKIENLPVDIPKITEKLDGSLGIQYYDGDKVCIATRGSFHSDQAVWATDWMQERFVKSDFREGCTYLYEIIYPENRIVVDYQGAKKLVLLGIIENDTGVDMDYTSDAKILSLEAATRLQGTLDDVLKQVDIWDGNNEGVVALYSNGLRIKIKGTEYKRLHRLLTGFSTKSIWECLKNNNLEEVLDRVPDEFMNWVKSKRDELLTQKASIESEAETAFRKVINLGTRKEQAQYLMKHHKNVSSLVFLKLDSRESDDRLWTMIKPKFRLPFKTENK